MQERQVTLAETTFALEDPFWVLATQNPIEQEGVYSLPEAQLDRFTMMLRVDYPSRDEEVQLLHVRIMETPVERPGLLTDVAALREFIRNTVFIDDKIIDYIVRLGRATRSPDEVGRGDLKELIVLGVSPRAHQHVLALARVAAFLHGRMYVVPGDVKEIFCDAARHRIARGIRAQAENIEADEILNQLLRVVPIP
jgi:MoxR-like ATPase